MIHNTCFDKIDYQYENALNNYLYNMKKNKIELTEDDEREIQRYAGNHIGFFITWILQHHFEGDIHKEENECVEAVRNEEVLGVDFLINQCDGKFWADDISEDIYPFVNSYYDKYLSEYTNWVINVLCDLPLEFIGSWDDYHNFEHIINTAFASYSKS